MCQYLDCGLNTIEPGILCKDFAGIPHACPSDHFGARFNVHQPLPLPLLPIIQPLLFKAEERRGRQTSNVMYQPSYLPSTRLPTRKGEGNTSNSPNV